MKMLPSPKDGSRASISVISKITTLLRLIAILVFLTACTAPSSQSHIEEIDTYLTQKTQKEVFSGAVLIAQEGEILLRKGYGMANAAEQISNTPQTRFRIHWITMPFTAVAVIMLQAEGQLSTEDAICEYIPNCPDHWGRITIHHLLTHTSGISDWIQSWDSATVAPASAGQLIEHFKTETPYFEPGADFRYSNNGYLILGYIIEKVSGQSYEAFLQQRVFEPAGMENTGLQGEDLAIGYKPDDSPAPPPDLLFRFSASGLYSTVEDLCRWNQALHNGEFIAQDDLDLMFTGYADTPSTDFAGSKYGYGWFIGETLERPVFLHGGVMAGYHAMILYFPGDDVTIIVLRNREFQIYDRLEIELAEMLFGEKST